MKDLCAALFFCAVSVSMPLAAEPIANFALSTSLMGPALRSSDLDRSVRYYTEGLGMVLARKLVSGTVTEAIFSFGPPQSGQAVILMFKDASPENSEPVANGFGRIMLRTTDVKSLAARLRAAGYPVGEVREIPEHHMKVLLVRDPDGYEFEITEQSMTKS